VYKKKLQKLGVACLAAVMVLTTVSFPSAVKAEGESTTQTESGTATELDQGKVVVQIDQEVLKANAVSNSNQNPVKYTNDGSASWAFDEQEHWWHSRYNFYNASYYASETLRDQTAVATENPWIGSGFEREVTLYKLTCQNRKYTNPNGNNGIKRFKLWVSRNGSDWEEAETISDELNIRESMATDDIVLKKPTKARYFRIEALSSHNRDTFVAGTTANPTDRDVDTNCSSVSLMNIKAYELKDVSLTIDTNDNYRVDTDEPEQSTESTYATTGTDGRAALSTQPRITGENAFDISQEMTVGTSSDVAFTDTTGTFAIQFTMRLSDALEGGLNPVYKADSNWSANEFSVSFNSSTGRVGAGVYGNAGQHYLSVNNAGHELSKSDWLNKDVRITVLKSGNNTMYLWVNGVMGSYQDHQTLAGTINSGQPMHVGVAGAKGEIKDFGVYKNIDRAVLTAAAAGTEPTKEQLAGDNKTVYGITATPGTKSAYSITSTATDGTESLGEDGTRSTKSIDITLSTKDGATIVKAPEALQVKIDANNTKVVPVSRASTVSGEGTSTSVNYKFESMKIGSSLRIDGSKDDYSMTSMRYGYDFKVPADTTFTGCEWYYGTDATGLVRTLSPDVTKTITNPDNKGADVYRSNIVFTNVKRNNFEKNVNAKILVKYAENGHTYSKMGLNVDADTVKQVASRIVNSSNSSDSEKIYAKGILGTQE